MRTAGLKSLIAVATAAAALGALPAAAGAAPSVGIGDQSDSMFSNPLFDDLGIRQARLIVPWDVTKHADDRAQADAWLNAAKADRVAPLVSFEHSRKSPRKLPSVAEYTAAFKAFKARYPFVKMYSPWNEANHQSQPTFHKPKAAAGFYNAVKKNCSGCKIVALDVLDQGGMVAYVNGFKKYAKKPKIWGLHNYRDTNRNRSSGTAALLAATKGQVWLTETGGIVAFDTAFPYNEQRAARSLTQMFKLARSSSRITELFIYAWNGAERGARFDAGLVNIHGKARPGYSVVKQNVVGGKVAKGAKLKLRSVKRRH